MRRGWCVALLLGFFARASAAQAGVSLTERIASLGTSTRVLVIGAHPDEDDRGLLAFLGRGRGVQVGVLYLTRGEGSPNLVGSESGEALGVLRTAEALSARQVDGAKLFFTRALDFGSVRDPREAMRHWTREAGPDALLGDLVAVVRFFRPHALISLHAGTDGDPDGQHVAASRIASGIAHLAADTVRFPVATFGAPWSPRVDYTVWNAPASAVRALGSVEVRTADHVPSLGRSWRSVGVEARRRLRSYGSAASPPLGSAPVVLLPTRGGEDSTAGLFGAMDTSMARLRPAARALDAAVLFDSVVADVHAAQSGFELDQPARSAPRLARLLVHAEQLLSRARATSEASEAQLDLLATVETLVDRAREALVRASGIGIEALGDRALVARATPGDGQDTLAVRLLIERQSAVPVVVEGTRMSGGPSRPVRSDSVPGLGIVWEDTLRVVAPSATEAWWRLAGRIGDTYALDVDGRDEATRQDAPSSGSLYVEALLRIADAPVVVRAPVIFRPADPRVAERRVVVVPGVTLRLDRPLTYVPANRRVERRVRVTIQSAFASERRVTVRLKAPAGLVADATERDVVLGPGASVFVDFALRGKLEAGTHGLSVEARVGNERYAHSFTALPHEHAFMPLMSAPALQRMLAPDVRIPPNAFIGYVAGGADFVPTVLGDLDVTVASVDAAALGSNRVDLARFGAIVLGPRAIELNPGLAAAGDALLRYARAGGSVLVLHGRAETESLGALPFAVRPRRPPQPAIGDDVALLPSDARSPLLRAPNALSERDWLGWQREKATLLIESYDPAWRPVVLARVGDDPPAAVLLASDVGRGRYVLSSLNLSRQLTSGNAAAARLLMNVIAARRGTGGAP